MKVTASTATFSVAVYLDHYGGNSSNSTLVIKVIDSDTGLLMEEVLSPIPEVEGEKTVKITNKISVTREGGYEIKLIVFDRDRMMESGSVFINGLEALTPEIRDVGVRIRDIDFLIRNVSEGKVKVETDIYVENTRDSSSPELKILVKAVQAESNIVADSVWINASSLRPESTAIRKAVITVPESYNYVIEAVFWNGDVMVDRYKRFLHWRHQRQFLGN